MQSKFYSTNISLTIKEQLREIDALQKQLDTIRLKNKDRFAPIYEKLKIDWTYTSNAIEGNSLSRGETLFFLQEGLTVEGKPFKDFLDARNHAEAIDFVFEVIKGERPLSESLLKTNLISSTGYNLIRVGEQSGNLAEMLRSYADILTESSQNRTRRFLTLMEPIAILVIGAVVGLIMGGIILAITSVNDIAV